MASYGKSYEESLTEFEEKVDRNTVKTERKKSIPPKKAANSPIEVTEGFEIPTEKEK